METCFLEAIEKMLKQGSHQLAGYTFVEMATQFEVLGEYDKSFAFLIRGLYKLNCSDNKFSKPLPPPWRHLRLDECSQ